MVWGKQWCKKEIRLQKWYILVLSVTNIHVHVSAVVLSLSPIRQSCIEFHIAGISSDPPVSARHDGISSARDLLEKHLGETEGRRQVGQEGLWAEPPAWYLWIQRRGRGEGFSWKSQSHQRRSQNVLGRLAGCPKQELLTSGVLNWAEVACTHSSQCSSIGWEQPGMGVAAVWVLKWTPKMGSLELPARGALCGQFCLKGHVSRVPLWVPRYYPTFDCYLSPCSHIFFC